MFQETTAWIMDNAEQQLQKYSTELPSVLVLVLVLELVRYTLESLCYFPGASAPHLEIKAKNKRLFFLFPLMFLFGLEMNAWSVCWGTTHTHTCSVRTTLWRDSLLIHHVAADLTKDLQRRSVNSFFTVRPGRSCSNDTLWNMCTSVRPCELYHRPDAAAQRFMILQD